jgi:hypothetical protein
MLLDALDTQRPRSLKETSAVESRPPAGLDRLFSRVIASEGIPVGLDCDKSATVAFSFTYDAVEDKHSHSAPLALDHI